MLFAGPYFFLVKLSGAVSFKSNSLLLKFFFRLRVAFRTRNFSLIINFCMSRNKRSPNRKSLLQGERGQTEACMGFHVIEKLHVRSQPAPLNTLTFKPEVLLGAQHRPSYFKRYIFLGLVLSLTPLTWHLALTVHHKGYSLDPHLPQEQHHRSLWSEKCKPEEHRSAAGVNE